MDATPQVLCVSAGYFLLTVCQLALLTPRPPPPRPIRSRRCAANRVRGSVASPRRNDGAAGVGSSPCQCFDIQHMASVTNGRINGTNCGWLTMIPSLRKPKLSGLAHAGEGESVLLLHGAEPDGKPVRETQFTVPS